MGKCYPIFFIIIIHCCKLVFRINIMLIITVYNTNKKYIPAIPSFETVTCIITLLSRLSRELVNWTTPQISTLSPSGTIGVGDKLNWKADTVKDILNNNYIIIHNHHHKVLYTCIKINTFIGSHPQAFILIIFIILWQNIIILGKVC